MNPSCKGGMARLLLNNAEDWLSMLLKPGEEEILEIWQIFHGLVAFARSYYPTWQHIQQFKTDLARLFVLHRLRLSDENYVYYIHTLCCHGTKFCLETLKLG
jgi:hypothetical protein